MDENNFNTASYGVKKRAEGKNLLYRLLTAVGLTVVSVGFCLLVTIPVKMPGLITVVPIFLLCGIATAKRLLCYDIEYQLECGILHFSRLYNNKKRKELFALTVKEAEKAEPLTDAIRTEDYDAVIDMRGTKKSPDSYLLVYRAPDGKRTLVLFEGATKLIKMMQHYNKRVVFSPNLSH